ncbi:MAG: DUF3990 domain-containing protein [Lachnospiraceae bacterium]|nr:DUF3990 domain-containing protein [Lachnospiraceae bacterium]
MRIYHGSDHIVTTPEYGKGKQYNDYGRGFYCTEDIDLACEWAVDQERDGFVSTYELSTTNLRILNLNSDPYCILHWITILLNNRQFELETPLSKEAVKYLSKHFMPDLTDVDIIIGYRADDSYFSYAQDFINGVISVSQLNKAMHLGNLGEQVFLRSKKAFDSIRFIEGKMVSAGEWYERKYNRDKQARIDYHKMNKDSYVRGELYMIRIIDEEVKADDPRLQ